MAHSKNAQRFFKNLGKRTGCHPYGISGGDHGVICPHWLAYSPELRPLRAMGPLALAAAMLKARKVEDTDEATDTTTIDPMDCPEPAGLQL